ncbi:MAG: lytic murein transglycosylase B [Gammaproteobacteria bacterium]|nr:lytic murein transglycosylase B [Gammaproteobacteria bacterium]
MRPPRQMYHLVLSLSLASGLLCSHACLALAEEPAFSTRPDVSSFIDRMVMDHAFDRDSLAKLLDQVAPREDIIAAISRPAESKPWYKYRPIFLTPERIRQGAEFMAANAETLTRAEAAYGIPPEIVTAIIGVETFYGRQAGGYRVIDALATLAFDYPPRSTYFLSELEQYLLLTREEEIDPLTIKGSYAGAMGKPQFMPSSYRNFAVDFDGDSKRDLWNNTEDAIGSVARYLGEHGWEPHQPVTSLASVEGDGYQTYLDQGLMPKTSLGEMLKSGVAPVQPLPEDLSTVLIRLEGENAPEYWLGFKNFYVITRYNRSPLYAMAVYQLSEELRNQLRDSVAPN